MSHTAIHVLIPHLLPAEYFAIGAAPLEPPSDTVSTIWSFEWHCAKSCHDHNQVSIKILSARPDFKIINGGHFKSNLLEH